MDKECERQINELNKLWHLMFIKSNYKDIELRYPNMQGLSNNELAIVRIISENEETIIKDIVDELNVPKSTLTSMIDRLENRDIIVRGISKRDRRSYKLELTDKGRTIQNEHDDFEKEIYGKIITSLDTYEEREQLITLIGKIADNISR